MQTSITKEKARVWRWEITNAGVYVAGGYCATKADAENDSRIAMESIEIDEARKAGRIAKGDKVTIAPEWQDAGDEEFDRFAVETQLPGMDSIRVRGMRKSTGEASIGVQSVEISMLAR